MTVRLTARLGVRFAVLGLALVELAGCTSLLGIDGEYGPSADAGGRDLVLPGPGGEGGAVGVTGDGGAGNLARADAAVGLAQSGGADGAGGVNGGELGAGGASGAPIVAGAGAGAGGDGGCGACPSPVGPCAPGAYGGPQSGQHAPTITVLGVQFDVLGTVKFRLGDARTGTSAIVDGVVDGTLQILGTPPFSATLTGAVDCETGRLDGVVDGKFWLTSNVNALPASTFHGAYAGAFVSGKFSGTWNEEEPNAPTTPPMTETGRGKGTWQAARTGP